MTNKLYISLLCIVACVAVSCSTKKNTGATRAYHELTTRYNVEFNAKIAYEEGIKALNDGCVDDYSRILPMYPISIPENATKASSQMETTIEKCRKVIKNHSITKKPKRDRKRWKDPKYQYFYNQEEYVKGVKRAWILLGKAELHKGDFLGAASTFIYIARHYPSDVDVVCEARIWQSRAYAELGWMYNAEEAFDKIKEEDVPERLKGLYAATRADYLLKNNRPQEAYPFLKVAAEREKNRFFKMRFHYILGQIAMETGRPSDAYAWFKKVKKASPPYLMQFNTELSMLQAQTKNKSKAIKGLKRMAKSPNNMEYLDQIYYAMGNIYAAMGDTVEALDAYAMGAELSTRNGIDKAVLLITKGDMHYGRKEYMDAHPCFEEATQLISATNPDYERVEKLGTTLGELAQNYNTVELQDSLQYLSTLSEAEQMTIIEKVIEEIKRQEEEEAKKAAEAEKRAEMLARRGMNNMGNIGPQGSQDWYFYNPQLKQKGSLQFQQKWGKRKLEDNWRRLNKTVMSFGGDETDGLFADSDSIAPGMAGDSTMTAGGGAVSSDIHDPEYHLSLIPKTEEQFAASDKAIADGLYAMGGIFASKLEDYEAAIDAYDRFTERFPDDERALEAYYACYQIAGKMGDESLQEKYKGIILSQFPESNYAIILSQPDYLEKMRAMFAKQDSIYMETYGAYMRGSFDTVMSTYAYMSAEYPLSNLMPKFSLLNALSIGRTRPQEELELALNDIVTKYPESDVAPMCKDILALITQGREAQQGTTVSTISQARTAQMTTIVSPPEDSLSFSDDLRTPHRLLLMPKEPDDKTLYALLYDVAAFNFTKFMIKDYDIAVETIGGRRAVAVSGIENYDEALWYEQMLLSEPMLQGRVTLDVCDRVVISDTNIGIINQGLSLEEYMEFYKNLLLKAEEEKKTR